MIKKATILVEIISTLGALASILWLFLDPGPEPFAASILCVSVILGIGVNAQLKLSRIQDSELIERLNAIKEFMQVIDDIPRLTTITLIDKLESDIVFSNSLTSRMVRLFGLRRECIPHVDPEIIDLIDNEFEQFYDIGVGSYVFKKDKLHEFALFAEKLTKKIREIENNLTIEHRKRF